MKKQKPKSLMKKCPSCGAKAYIVSIFGSVCGHCFYDPKQSTLHGR